MSMRAHTCMAWDSTHTDMITHAEAACATTCAHSIARHKAHYAERARDVSEIRELGTFDGVRARAPIERESGSTYGSVASKVKPPSVAIECVPAPSEPTHEAPLPQST